MTADAGPALPQGLTVEVVRAAEGWASETDLSGLAEAAVAAACAVIRFEAPQSSDLAVLFADDAHVRDLNARFRGKDKSTNVLSFPGDMDGGGPEATHLGDIVLAYETVAAEAKDEDKPFDHHLAHLVVHGFLHVIGYDHEDAVMAEEMEGCERAALARLEIPDPYGDAPLA
ncbi:rRNA maturation RNase YbeY [Amorphus sp. 3PC139-8]|uniref:rRNA maturation RNase YbeY n=1 Tax=Amorphus sp. 3PC139-8 TaxID=2735676 RepID=UPI00345D5A44